MLEYPWKLANTKKCSTMTKVACVDAYLQSNALVEYFKQHNLNDIRLICCVIFIQHGKIYFNPEEVACLDV
jgi:cobalamin biosynthesis Co2+ chelatase CbiK